MNTPTAWQGLEADGLGSLSEALWVCDHVLPNSPAGPGKVPHACVPGIVSSEGSLQTKTYNDDNNIL